jgi:hypothetical protein
VEEVALKRIVVFAEDVFMQQKRIWLVAVMCAALNVGAQARAACVDVRQTEPLSFKGALSRQVFPGPPNYEDVRKGDTPERAFIIKLDAPICATGDEFLDSSEAFDTVQLLVDNSAKGGPALLSSLTRLIGKRVLVMATSGFGAENGHHHAPLLATVVSIAADGAGAAGR